MKHKHMEIHGHNRPYLRRAGKHLPFYETSRHHPQLGRAPADALCLQSLRDCFLFISLAVSILPVSRLRAAAAARPTSVSHFTSLQKNKALWVAWRFSMSSHRVPRGNQPAPVGFATPVARRRNQPFVKTRDITAAAVLSYLRPAIKKQRNRLPSTPPFDAIVGRVSSGSGRRV